MNYQLILADALKEARSRNSLYSMRAMAKQLQLSSAHLSQLLSGKRPLTLGAAVKIAEALDMPDTAKNALLQSVIERKSGKTQSSKQLNIRVLAQSEIEPISDWYYFAILSLSKMKKNQASAKWISDQLGIPFSDAKYAYEKLKDLGHIEERRGKFFQVSPMLHSTREISSQAIRKYHKQNLELAKDRIDTVPVDLREYTSITVAVHESKINHAKEMIHDFKMKLYRYLNSESADAVYTLAIQFFPLTQKIDTRSKK